MWLCVCVCVSFSVVVVVLVGFFSTEGKWRSCMVLVSKSKEEEVAEVKGRRPWLEEEE